MPVPDRRLSANFTLYEVPCARERAAEADVSRLKETVQRVVQPFRSHVAAVYGEERAATFITSWRWWRDGCEARDGAHGEGGTVDLDTPALDDEEFRAAFGWGTRTLLPSGYLGRWILEPTMHDAEGHRIQGRHIHAAPVGDMWAAFRIDDIGAFLETSPGQYTPAAGAAEGGATWNGHTGAYGDPIPVPGFRVAVPFNYSRWLALGLLGGILWEQAHRDRRG